MVNHASSSMSFWNVEVCRSAICTVYTLPSVRVSAYSNPTEHGNLTDEGKQTLIATDPLEHSLKQASTWLNRCITTHDLCQSDLQARNGDQVA
jgi:hypothetical protein